jgi:capsular polysaccharide biosynthesis protein
MHPEPHAGPDQDERIPIHIWTIVIGVIRRRRFFAIFALVSVILALALAVSLGAPIYQAQSVILYHPDSDDRSNDPAITVQTQANMVLLESNLEETRRRLQIPVSVKQLASACEVKTQPNAALLMIDVLWNSPEIAARIANTLRDVFVSTHQNVRQTSAAQDVADLRARIDQLRTRVGEINHRLDEFSDSSGLVDLDKETQNYLTELTSTELLYDQARAEKLSIDMQIRTAERLLRERDRRASLKDQPPGELNSHYTRLRDAIHEDQSIRTNLEKLNLAKVEMDRSKALYEEQLLPKSEYDKAALNYRAQKETALDTDQVKTWRDQMTQINHELASADQSAQSKEAMQKLFQLQLDQVAAEQKVKTLQESVDRLRKKINTLPKLQRDYLLVASGSDSSQNELKLLEERLGRAERAKMARSPEFVTVADATPPAYPAKSRRTIIFLAVSCLGMMLGLAIVLTRELLDGTVRSAGEAGVKISAPLLGSVPLLSAYKGLPRSDERIPEPFRALAVRLLRAIPNKGARLLLISARQGEGVTTVTTYLAEGLRHERLQVLVRELRAGTSEDTSADELVKNGVPPHDVVLLDGPPILEFIDSEVLAPLCDAAVFVIAAGTTPASAVEEAIARIRATRVPVAGVILNRVLPQYL